MEVLDPMYPRFVVALLRGCAAVAADGVAGAGVAAD